MENTLENKSKLFAQYYGQLIGKIIDSTGNWVVGVMPVQSIDYLELKPLSAISDEDAIEVAEILSYPNKKAVIFFLLRDVTPNAFIEYSACNYNQPASIDFLRSRGYALPFLGLSVEDQEKYGWIKLTPSPDNQ